MMREARKSHRPHHAINVAHCGQRDNRGSALLRAKLLLIKVNAIGAPKITTRPDMPCR